jgi:hypothetical protein
MHKQIIHADVFTVICAPNITMDQVNLHEQIGQDSFEKVFRGLQALDSGNSKTKFCLRMTLV